MGADYTQVQKVCAVCGKGFSVVKSREFTATVCSRECKGKVSAAKYSAARIKRNCLHCGVEIEVVPKKANINGKYCSVDCKNKAATIKPRSGKATENQKENFYGYISEKAKDHFFAVDGYVLKHRLVVEKRMREEVPDHKFLVEIDGVKYLRREIDVHHIDHDKTNNSLDNLVACTAAAHNAIHDNCHVLEGEIYPDLAWIEKRTHRGIKCECQTCSKEFYVPQRTIKMGSGKFCSVKCKAESQRNSVKVACQTCGNTFTAWASTLKLGHGKFCSNACYHDAKKGHANKYVFPDPVVKP